MKKIAGLLVALSVAGCMTPHNVSHNYAPTPTPALAGLWVGSNAIQTHTMLIRPDGTGELCYEYMGKYKSTSLTISGDKIIAMSEAKFTVNANGTLSQCAWGTCVNFRRTEHIAAACREWLKS